MIEKIINEESLSLKEQRDAFFVSLYSLSIKSDKYFDKVEDWFFTNLSDNSSQNLAYLYENDSLLENFKEVFSDDESCYYDKSNQWFTQSDIKDRNDFLKLLDLSPKKLTTFLSFLGLSTAKDKKNIFTETAIIEANKFFNNTILATKISKLSHV